MLRSFALFFVTCFFLAGPLAAQENTTPSSCDCHSGELEPLDSALSKASLVFTGRVSEVKMSSFRKQYQEVRLVVGRLWKGSLGQFAKNSVLVHSIPDEAKCGINFIDGQDYLVFISGSPAFYKTDICARTRLLNLAREDIEILLGPQKQDKPTEETIVPKEPPPAPKKRFESIDLLY